MPDCPRKQRRLIKSIMAESPVKSLTEVLSLTPLGWKQKAFARNVRTVEKYQAAREHYGIRKVLFLLGLLVVKKDVDHLQDAAACGCKEKDDRKARITEYSEICWHAH